MRHLRGMLSGAKDGGGIRPVQLERKDQSSTLQPARPSAELAAAAAPTAAQPAHSGTPGAGIFTNSSALHSFFDLLACTCMSTGQADLPQSFQAIASELRESGQQVDLSEAHVAWRGPTPQSTLLAEFVSTRLIYSTTQHERSPASFHAHCDGHGPCVLLLRDTVTGLIVGGFTSVGWDSRSGFVKDTLAFLFSLDPSTDSLQGGQERKYWPVEPHKSSRAVYCSAAYGPAFGDGPDLVLMSNSQPGHVAHRWSTFGSPGAFPLLGQGWADIAPPSVSGPTKTRQASTLQAPLSRPLSPSPHSGSQRATTPSRFEPYRSATPPASRPPTTRLSTTRASTPMRGSIGGGGSIWYQPSPYLSPSRPSIGGYQAAPAPALSPPRASVTPTRPSARGYAVQQQFLGLPGEGRVSMQGSIPTVAAQAAGASTGQPSHTSDSVTSDNVTSVFGVSTRFSAASQAPRFQPGRASLQIPRSSVAAGPQAPARSLTPPARQTARASYHIEVHEVVICRPAERAVLPDDPATPVTLVDRAPPTELSRKPQMEGDNLAAGNLLGNFLNPQLPPAFLKPAGSDRGVTPPNPPHVKKSDKAAVLTAILRAGNDDIGRPEMNRMDDNSIAKHANHVQPLETPGPLSPGAVPEEDASSRNDSFFNYNNEAAAERLQQLLSFAPDGLSGQAGQTATVNILLLGGIASGKSSFLNTVDAVLQGTLSRRADVGVIAGGTRPMTRRLIKHNFYAEATAAGSTRASLSSRRSQGSMLGFSVWDSPGWLYAEQLGDMQQTGVGNTYLPEELGPILEGAWGSHYDLTKPANQRDWFGYNVSPRLEDKVHALALCVPCWAAHDARYMRQTREIWAQAVDKGVRVVMLLTQMDEARGKGQSGLSSSAEAGLRAALSSRQASELRQAASEATGIPLNCILYVKSFHQELDVRENPLAVHLVLLAMQQLLLAANASISERSAAPLHTHLNFNPIPTGPAGSWFESEGGQNSLGRFCESSCGTGARASLRPSLESQVGSEGTAASFEFHFPRVQDPTNIGAAQPGSRGDKLSAPADVISQGGRETAVAKPVPDERPVKLSLGRSGSNISGNVTMAAKPAGDSSAMAAALLSRLYKPSAGFIHTPALPTTSAAPVAFTHEPATPLPTPAAPAAPPAAVTQAPILVVAASSPTARNPTTPATPSSPAILAHEPQMKEISKQMASEQYPAGAEPLATEHLSTASPQLSTQATRGGHDANPSSQKEGNREEQLESNREEHDNRQHSLFRGLLREVEAARAAHELPPLLAPPGSSLFASWTTKADSGILQDGVSPSVGGRVE